VSAILGIPVSATFVPLQLVRQMGMLLRARREPQSPAAAAGACLSQPRMLALPSLLCQQPRACRRHGRSPQHGSSAQQRGPLGWCRGQPAALPAVWVAEAPLAQANAPAAVAQHLLRRGTPSWLMGAGSCTQSAEVLECPPPLAGVQPVCLLSAGMARAVLVHERQHASRACYTSLLLPLSFPRKHVNWQLCSQIVQQESGD